VTLGPIDFLAIEFPGKKFNSEMRHSVMDLINNGIIQV